MDDRTKVTILTSSYRVRGYIDLVPAVRNTGGRQVASAPFINVSRDHIEIIMPGH